jgi:protein-S-isoprenylcysteine O-methyltransferase Ste14
MSIKIPFRVHTSFSVIIRLILWAVMLFGGAWYAWYIDRNTELFQNFYFHLFSVMMGIMIITLAFRAAANGGRELSKGRVGNIPRLETNRLVTTGLFGCMRHPMLFGLTLLPLGWAFLLGSPTFILYIAPLEMLFIIGMVLVFEEMEIKRKFQKEYLSYKKEVPMVTWDRKCLKLLFKKFKG